VARLQRRAPPRCRLVGARPRGGGLRAHRAGLQERGLDLAPIDRATLAYLALALGFHLAYGPRDGRLALAPLLIVALGLTVALLVPRARREASGGAFLAEFYPLLLTPALYTHVGIVNTARGVTHDALVQEVEQKLFSGQPSLEWIRSYPSPLLSTVMHAAYVSYYALLVLAPLVPWLAGRREAARRTLLLTMAAFYACYATSLAFPVAGPRFEFPPAENAATAVPIAVAVRGLLEGGSAWGTAFPSSHVAAAVVAAGCSFATLRPLGAVLVPIALLLSLATVYCQFHYAVDSLAGAALGAFVLLVGLRPRGMMLAREGRSSRPSDKIRSAP
jgi:membrane-associated phospholipid phosphatase